MADNAFVKIGTALLKHQVKKLVGDETLEVIGEELADIGGDKLDAWLGERSTQEELEKAAQSAQTCFREKVTDNELQQWMVSLPLGNLPKVVEAVDELPLSPNESKLENALRESIALNWKKLSSEQVDSAVNSFLSCLRSALLPIEKQTLMVIGRSVLRTEDKVDLLVRWFEQYIITGKPVEVKQLHPEPVETWNLKHPYAMPPNFTGRVEERKMLADWLNKDNENRLFILRALGGFGKSALSWHWLTHDVEANEWKKVLWWSFYEGDASFEHFIEETLKYLKLEVPQGQRPQVDKLLDAMKSQKILLIMDGFEHALRLYSNVSATTHDNDQLNHEDAQLDCININAHWFLIDVCAQPNFKTKILMTTRFTPRAIKSHGELMLGCREVELDAMQKVDAVEFFRKQGIKGTYAEIEAACAPYGYHPLSLRLLAGRILKDFENPADIVVAQKLKIDGDIIHQKHHVLEISYNSLPPTEQKLLSAIACFRSPVELKTLRAIVENKDTLNTDLHDLADRGLLYHNARLISDHRVSIFDLHPIVRHYSYERLPDKKTVHRKIAKYLQEITKFDPISYPSYIAHWVGRNNYPSHWTPKDIQNLDDIHLFVELYHHMMQLGDLKNAYSLVDKLIPSLVNDIGDNQNAIEFLRIFFPNGEDRLEKEISQWEIVYLLAVAYIQNGQPHRSLRLFEHLKKLSSNPLIIDPVVSLRSSTLISLGSVRLAHADLQAQIKTTENTSLTHFGNLSSKKMGASNSIAMFSRLANGYLMSLCGDWDVAQEELSIVQSAMGNTSQDIISSLDKNFLVWAYRAQLMLIMSRKRSQTQAENHKQTIIYAQKALDIAEKPTRITRTNLNIVRARWLLGAAYRISGHLQESESCLTEAIVGCHTINNIEYEANILLDLARLSFDYGLAASAQDRIKFIEHAKSLAEEALLITERCGYVLQGADVNLFLAELTLTLDASPEGRGKARAYAEEALKLATCDGPPYYYKVAYEEAERMLENLK